MESERDPRTVTDRDFLIGSVWEGSGDELHTNRHVARQTMFGGRVLSGISGMLLVVDQAAPELLWSEVSDIEWSFDAPLFEGDEVRATTQRDGSTLRLSGSMADRRTRGAIVRGAPHPAVPVHGDSTKGRTMTPADLDLFASWLGRRDGAPEVVPWPLVALTASGLITRSKTLGPHEMLLNRWFRWSFVSPVPIDETVHCVVAPAHPRRSRSRPELRVAEHDVAVVSSVDDRQYARFRWVVMYP